MTTIAYKNNKFAADSQMSMGGTPDFVTSRKVRKKKNTVVAACGDAGFACMAMDILLDLCQTAKNKIDLAKAMQENTFLKNNNKDWDTIIIIHDPKFFLEIRNIQSILELDKLGMYAWGSGWRPALTAMKLGKNAKAAVKMSKKMDNGTGGQVVVKKASKLKKSKISCKKQSKMKIPSDG